VYIQMFENRSAEVGAEASFTQALTRELQRSGFAIVSTKEAADLVLSGTILNVFSVDGAPITRFFEEDHAAGTSRRFEATLFRQFNLSVQASLKATRSRDDQVIWQTNLRGQKSYRGAEVTRQGARSSNVLYNQSRRAQTVKLIAQEMMEEAFDRLTENF
jgi:hypothetical protein